MLRRILPPRMQDRRDANRAAEVTRVASEGEQGVRGRTEEERVEYSRITLREGVETVRQREDDVEVRNRQEVGTAGGEPPLFDEGLTLGAMTVAAGIISEAHAVAVITRLPMAAERGRAARLDRVQGAALDSGEPVGTSVRVPVAADDGRELEPGCRGRDGRAPRHGAHGLSARRREPLQQIERRVGPHFGVAGQL